MNRAALQVEFMTLMQRFGKVNMGAMIDGLSKGEFFILEVLCGHLEAHGDAQSMYVFRLAELMRASPPAISRSLKQLEGKGFIERSVDSDNRRNTFIRVTDEGMRMRQHVKEQLLKVTGRVFDAMGEERMRTLLMLWGQMVDILEREIGKTDKGDAECLHCSST